MFEISAIAYWSLGGHLSFLSFIIFFYDFFLARFFSKRNFIYETSFFFPCWNIIFFPAPFRSIVFWQNVSVVFTNLYSWDEASSLDSHVKKLVIQKNSRALLKFCCHKIKEKTYNIIFFELSENVCIPLRLPSTVLHKFNQKEFSILLVFNSWSGNPLGDEREQVPNFVIHILFHLNYNPKPHHLSLTRPQQHWFCSSYPLVDARCISQ